MSGKPPNYYDVLGVSLNATKKEIAAKYTKLIKENHPDKFEGLKNKYEAENDKELLKVLEKAIAEAVEKSKQINEAYSILSNTNKRKSYDSSLVNIVITPTKLNLGSIEQGRKATASFIIESKGAKIGRITIDWLNKKTWGDLDIEPDPDNDFPIKVTIKVSTIGLAPGTFNGQVYIEIDGEQHYVPMDFKVVPIKKPSVDPSHIRTKSGVPWRMLAISIISVVAIGSLAIATVSISKENSREKQFAIAQETIAVETIPTHVPTPTEPPRVTLEEIQRRYEVQNSKGSRIDLEGEISLFATNPEELVKIERLGTVPLDDESSSTELYGDYVVVNLSKYSEVLTCRTMWRCGGILAAPDEYDSFPLVLEGDNLPPLYPGGKRVVRCEEYEVTYNRWDGPYGCFYVTLQNQTGWYEVKRCVDFPTLPIDLSSLVKISAKQLPTKSLGYTGILEFEFQIGNIPYILVARSDVTKDYWGQGGWFKQDPKDSRLFVGADLIFKPGDLETRYALLREGPVPNEACFELSMPYVPSKTVCVKIQ